MDAAETAKDHIFDTKTLVPVSESYWAESEVEFQEKCQKLFVEARLKRQRKQSNADAAAYQVLKNEKKAQRAEKSIGSDAKKMKKAAKLDLEMPFMTRKKRWVAQLNQARKGEQI